MRHLIVITRGCERVSPAFLGWTVPANGQIDHDGRSRLRLCFGDDPIKNVVDVPNRIIIAVDAGAKVWSIAEEFLAQAIVLLENVPELLRNPVTITRMQGIEIHDDKLPRSRILQRCVQIWKQLVVVKLTPQRSSD